MLAGLRTLDLTHVEVEALGSVCDTLFPLIADGDPLDRRSASDLRIGDMQADAVQHSLQPRNAKDFRRVISAFESPLYNLILSGRAVRFSRLNPASRERYLQAWRDSPISLKRSAYQALKRLTLFLAYASVDDRGRNPNWEDIGYPGPQGNPPVPVPDRLRLKPLAITSDSKLTCDVVVVGSGAGGSVIADTLAGYGLDVIVLEQGPYETSETFKQNEMRMMQKLFQQSGTATTKDLSFVLLAGRGAGGGTTVNWNTCLKPPARVLSEWEKDFGIDGVSGPGFAAYLDEVWRTMEVNSRESQRNGNNGALWDGCRALGYKEGSDYHLIERNAVGCEQRCDYCTYGCIYSAKRSTTMNYLPSAQGRGARLVFDCRVERVVIEGGAARGVVATCQANGITARLEVASRAVVAACGGIETPALLLRSGVRDRNLGRHLRLDPTVAVGGIFEKPIEPWKGPPQTVAVWKFIDLDGTYHGFWVEAAPVHPGLFAFHPLGERQAAQGLHAAILLTLVRFHRPASRAEFRSCIRRQGRVCGGDVQPGEAGPGERSFGAWMKRQGSSQPPERTGVWTTHNDQVFAGDGKGPLKPAELDSFAALLRVKGIHCNRIMLSAPISWGPAG